MRINVLSTGSTGNCYIVESNNNYIILDCGIKFEDITGNENFPSFSKIDFLFTSHCHGDHNKSLKQFKQSGVEIISYETLQPKIQHHEFDNWSVTTFPLRHNVPNNGIIIKHKITNESLVYMTDFNKAPKVENVQTYLYEVNYIESYIDKMIDDDKDLRHIGFNNHNSLENAEEYFASLKTKPQTIICCHLSKSNSIERIIQKRISVFCENTKIAHKGDEFIC